jgi:CheY-like chemotaxis protein
VQCQLLQQLRASNDADAAAMRQAMAMQDMALVARSAHRMAGANMLFGAAAFASACLAIAHAGRNEDAAAAAAAVSPFDAEWARLDAYLAQADAALQRALPQAAEPALPQASRLSVLVVDDHALQRYSVRMLLSQLGVGHIAEAADGQAALRMIGESGNHFDIVISDLDMPNMDGMELVRHLARHRHPSVILSSSHEPSLLASVAAMSEAYGIRPLGVIEKPIRRDLLAALIARHVDNPAAYQPRMPANTPHYPQERLVEGMGNGEFEAFFQPKIDIATGQIVLLCHKIFFLCILKPSIKTGGKNERFD